MIEREVRSGTPPTIPFTSLLVILDEINKFILAHGEMPARVDKTFWRPIFKDNLGYVVNSALKWLDLLRPVSNAPTLELERLARPESRQQALHDILPNAYGDLISLLCRPDVTREEINRVVERQWGVQGTTRRRCVGFLIPATRFAGYPVAPHLVANADALRRRFESSGSAFPQEEEEYEGGKASREAAASSSHSSAGASSPEASMSPALPASSGAVVAHLDSSDAPGERFMYLVQGLVHRIPSEGKWTKARRDRLVQALEAILDALVEVVEPEDVEAPQKTTSAYPAGNGHMRS